MNKEQLYAERKKAKGLLDWRMVQNSKKNIVKIGKNEGLVHVLKKARICFALLHLGKEFYTEAVFKNKSRADIFVLDNKVAIEVLDSEKQESIEAKKEKYPCRIVGIGVDEEWKAELIN